MHSFALTRSNRVDGREDEQILNRCDEIAEAAGCIGLSDRFAKSVDGSRFFHLVRFFEMARPLQACRRLPALRRRDRKQMQNTEAKAMKAMYWIGMVSTVSCFACDRDDPGRMEPLEENVQPIDEPDMDRAPTSRDEVKPEALDEADEQKEDQKEAKADLQAAEGAKIDGEARFSENGDGVKIVVNVKDAPVGEKGIHIHEKGDCSDIAGESMGSHFAPEDDKHGLPGASPEGIHLGDLGNIEIKDDGTGKKEITIDKANLKDGDSMSLLGKALVIHQDKDKGASHQPSGGSGKPIACGVIEKS